MRHAAPHHMTALRRRQGAMLIIGIMALACGTSFLCSLAALATVSWSVIGLMLCATGATQLATAVQLRECVGLLMWLPVVIFYFLFGLVSLTEPPRSLALLSLVFFAGLIVTGVLRAYCGICLRYTNGWGWLVATGFATGSTGVFLMSRWPDNSLTIVGVLIAIDIMIYGLGFIGFALKANEARNDPGAF